jgi:transposase
MSKLSYEDKINIYYEKKKGRSRKDIASKYKIQQSNVQYLVRLIDKHGFNILRTTSNKKYTYEEKERIINRVLINNEARLSVAIDEGLSSVGMLINWIKEYKKMGYNIVERKRRRSPTMSKKIIKPKKNETIEEENERLKKENLYLKAELEYSKKLRAVVQSRKNQQQKKK